MNAKEIFKELKQELNKHNAGCIRNEAAGVYMPRHEFQNMLNLLDSLGEDLDTPKKADQLSEVEVWKVHAENWKEAAMAWKALASATNQVAMDPTEKPVEKDYDTPTVQSIIQYGEDILDLLRGDKNVNQNAWFAVMSAIDKAREKPLPSDAIVRRRVNIYKYADGIGRGTTEACHYQNSLDIFKNELSRQGFYPVIVDNKNQN